jgi:erythromycin esterase-like protein
MLDFVRWIKRYNDDNNKKINLYGFDIQSNIDIVKDLLKFYEKTDKEAENFTTALIIIFENNNMWSFRDYSALLKDSVMAIISRLEEKHALNRKDYIIKVGIIEYEYSAKRIETLSNCLQMMISGYGQALIMRDSCNAELIKWIKNFEGEKSKIILLAHNGHLGKSLCLTPRERTLSTQGFYEDYSEEFITGYYLSETFDDEYYFIGTQFGTGFFMGFDPDNDFLLSKLEVTSPEPYSFPHILQQAENKSQYFIDLNFTMQTPRQIINYLCSFQSFYEIGAAYDSKYAKTRLIDYFDAIIYIDKIEESEMLTHKE